MRLPQPLERFSSSLPVPVRGALWMLFSGASFAVVAASVRAVTGMVHPFEVAFFRTLFLLVFMLPTMWGTGLSAFHTRRWGVYGLRAVITVAAMMTWFTALKLMPIAEVTALTFTAPLFSTIGGALILRESVGPRRWAAVAVGFVGTLIILRPGAEAMAAGSLVALMAAVLMSASQLCVKSLARTESPAGQILVIAVLTTAGSLVPALFVWTVPPAEAWPWLVLAGLGATGVQMGLAKAMSLVDLTAVLPFDFSRLVFAALLGFLIFGEVLDAWAWLGAVVIFGAAFYTARREARLNAGAGITPPLRS